MNFGKFEILAELGQGAMGKVYRAHDPILDRPVALKTVAPALLTGKDTLARFLREARAAARLTHPNIVTIYERGEVEGTHYIAMELVEGIDLGEAMTAIDRYTLEQKVRMVVDVCRGLHFAHRMGVVHRDVKPANIRLTRDGTVKILDFGIAKRGAEFTDPNLTQAGMVLGTPSYLSPELLQGAKVNHRADMWAVGVILYEIVSGRRPFEAPTITSLITRIVSAPPPPLDASLRLPEGLAAAALRALDKDPDRRFADLDEMAKALLAAIGATPPPELPLDPVVKKRAYESNFADARRMLAEEDLSGALEAARRAQLLDPARTGIVSLIKVIEQRLGSAITLRRTPSETAQGAGSDATRTAIASPAPAAPSTATVPGLPVPPGPLDTATLRARGAGAFRELGTFGEPPATKEAALSPVADLFAVAGADGAIRLWELRSRNRVSLLRSDLHRRTGHDAAALALAYSPDGSLLASAHVDGVVHLWDMATGNEVPVRLRHDESVGALAFSPDGATLATGSLDANLRLFDVGAALAGEARRELVRQPTGVTALTWIGGGEWILTGHSSKILRLTDPHRNRLIATLRGPEALVNQLVLSPDGRHLAVSSHDRIIRLYDLATREQVGQLAALKRPATSVCFLAEGGYLASVCQDNSVQLWDLESRSLSATLWGPSDETFVALALFGESNHLAAAVGDGRIRVWGPS